MARKFSGAARARGFAPIQVSNANINRMREENQRIVEGMRARQESIRENDQRALQEMKDNAAYRQRVRDRDYQIEDRNKRNELLQSQYDARGEQFQAKENAKVMNAFVDSIVTISDTARKIREEALKKESEELKKKHEQHIQEYGGIDALSSKANALVGEELITGEMLKGNINIGRALGIPESSLQGELYNGVGKQMHFVQLSFAHQTKLEFPGFRAEYIREKGIDVLSDPVKAQEASNEAWEAFKEKTGMSKFSPEFYSKAVLEKAASDKVLTDGVEVRQAENFKAKTITAVNNAIIANPTPEELSAGYRTIVSATGSHAEGHAWVKEQVTAMDAEGNFVLPDSWRTMSLRENGKPYYTGDPKNPGEHEARGVELETAREVKRREWRTNQRTTERLDHYEKSKAWRIHVLANGNFKDAGAAAQAFKHDPFGMPDWLRRFRGSGDPSKGGYNSGLITQAKEFQARKILNQDLIDKVYEVDPKVANDLQKSYNEQDPFSRNDMYKKYMDSIDKLPMKQIGSTDLWPEPNSGAIRDAAKLKKVYQQLVQRGVADGASIADASYTALDTIESGFDKEDSPFRRVYNTNTGFYEFTALHKKSPKEIAQSLDEADKQFLKNLDAGHNKVNLKKAMFAQPEIVLTSEQYDQQIVDMKSPGFTFHPRIDMLVRSGAVGSHMQALALVGEAQGKPAIEPPPSLQVVTEYSPEAQRLLRTDWSSANRNARAHGMGTYTVGTGWNEGLVPATLREFYRSAAEQSGISPAENSAMGEVESHHNTANVNAKGMSVSYNGTSEGPMMINRSAHPEFYAQHGGNPSVEANIAYGTEFYASLKRQYDNDPIVAAMAYNGGPGTYDMWKEGVIPDWVQTDADFKEWNRIVAEMINHGRKFAGALYKYSGDPAILQHPILLRN